MLDWYAPRTVTRRAFFTKRGIVCGSEWGV